MFKFVPDYTASYSAVKIESAPDTVAKQLLAGTLLYQKAREVFGTHRCRRGKIVIKIKSETTCGYFIAKELHLHSVS